MSHRCVRCVVSHRCVMSHQCVMLLIICYYSLIVGPACRPAGVRCAPVLRPLVLGTRSCAGAGQQCSSLHGLSAHRIQGAPLSRLTAADPAVHAAPCAAPTTPAAARGSSSNPDRRHRHNCLAASARCRWRCGQGRADEPVWGLQGPPSHIGSSPRGCCGWPDEYRSDGRSAAPRLGQHLPRRCPGEWWMRALAGDLGSVEDGAGVTAVSKTGVS